MVECESKSYLTDFTVGVQVPCKAFKNSVAILFLPLGFHIDAYFIHIKRLGLLHNVFNLIFGVIARLAEQ